MKTTQDPFATAIALPTLTDAGMAALMSGNLRAVDAIARAMQRREGLAEPSPKPSKVGTEAIARLEECFGGLG